MSRRKGPKLKNRYTAQRHIYKVSETYIDVSDLTSTGSGRSSSRISGHKPARSLQPEPRNNFASVPPGNLKGPRNNAQYTIATSSHHTHQHKQRRKENLPLSRPRYETQNRQFRCPTQTQAYVHARTHTQTHAQYAHTCTRAHLHMLTHPRTHTHIHKHKRNMHTHAHTRTNCQP